MSEFTIKPQVDEAQGEIEHLEIKNTFETLSQFLQLDSTITPMSIAIHGEWGSGKTNLLKALQNNLDKDKTHVIFFEAWKYESSSPTVALISSIANELAENANLGIELIRMAVDAFIRKNLDDTVSNITTMLRTGFDATSNLSNRLSDGIRKKLGNKKLIILIDDLDRCDVEHSLEILAMMKLFLDIKNCICVAAIDFHRLEQAWFSKYGIKDDTNSNYTKEGRQYLEKIFQVRIPIPHPNLDARKRFLLKLIPTIPPDLLDILAWSGPINPRGMKRILNLSSYRTLLLNNDHAGTFSLIWTLMEDILTPEKACRVYEILKSKRGFMQEISAPETTWDVMQAHLSSEMETIFKKKDSPQKFRFFCDNFRKIFDMMKPEDKNDTQFEKLYNASKELQS